MRHTANETRSRPAARNYRGSGEIDPIDLHLGARLRHDRLERGWSQGELGRRLGVTFQQIQKYEKGSNGLSAARLHAAALAFGRPIMDFFDGYPGPSARPEAAPGERILMMATRQLRAIESPGLRREAGRLIASLAKCDAEQRRATPSAAE